jgi:hypothetical protein
MPSYASDNAAESCWRQRCQGDLAVTQRRGRVMLTIVVSSHAGDSATKFAWRWGCRVLLVMVLLSPTDDGTTESCW